MRNDRRTWLGRTKQKYRLAREGFGLTRPDRRKKTSTVEKPFHFDEGDKSPLTYACSDQWAKRLTISVMRSKGHIYQGANQTRGKVETRTAKPYRWLRLSLLLLMTFPPVKSMFRL